MENFVELFLKKVNCFPEADKNSGGSKQHLCPRFGRGHAQIRGLNFARENSSDFCNETFRMVSCRVWTGLRKKNGDEILRDFFMLIFFKCYCK